MLSAVKISKRYKNNRRQILSSIDIALDGGEFVAVMGESGSGKSTLLAVLSGILSPDEGHVLLDGKDLYALSDAELAQVHRTKIGYVPQSNFFLKNYTIHENVVEPFVTTKGSDTEEFGEKAQKHLENLGIEELSDRYPHEL